MLVYCGIRLENKIFNVSIIQSKMHRDENMLRDKYSKFQLGMQMSQVSFMLMNLNFYYK